MEKLRTKRRKVEQQSNVSENIASRSQVNVSKPIEQLSAFAAAKARQQQAQASARNPDNADSLSNDFASGDLAVESVDSLSASDSEDSEVESPTELQSGTARNRQLCTWNPHPGTILHNHKKSLGIRLAKGETFTLSGQYRLEVISGLCFMYGALLRPKSSFTVNATSTHALPVIECISNEGAELIFWNENDGLRPLAKLSPLFDRIWNFRCKAVDAQGLQARDPRSFSFVQHSMEDPYKRPLFPLEISDNWRQVIHKICSNKQKPIVTMVCGPKSAGKSTLSRILLNRLLTPSNSSSQSTEAVYYLDLDPGQPEFSPSGQLSLALVHEPNFGPHFIQSHSYQPKRILRAHTLAAISPAENAKHFLACALELIDFLERNRSDENRRTSVVINCPGWYIGTGLDLVINLIQSIPSMTDVVAINGTQGKAIDQITAVTSDRNVRLHVIEPQPSSGSEARTSAEYRDMQMLSYFHHQQLYSGDSILVAEPLSMRRPYLVSYSPELTAFKGIMDYGDFPPQNSLSTLLNGTIIAIVQIEDGSVLEQRELSRQNDLQIPFFQPGYDGYTAPLDPRKSRLLGLALIRAIDVENHALHLVTPLAEETITALDPEKVVLVRGSYDTPGWAYKEDIYFGEWTRRHGKKTDDGAGPNADDIGEVKRPWVRWRRDDGKGLLGASWRTRRFQ